MSTFDPADDPATAKGPRPGSGKELMELREEPPPPGKHPGR